jgi:hypothetical protein
MVRGDQQAASLRYGSEDAKPKTEPRHCSREDPQDRVRGRTHNLAVTTANIRFTTSSADKLDVSM